MNRNVMNKIANKNICYNIGIAIGIITIIVGIVFILNFKDETFYSYFSFMDKAEFGTDFYTYSYRASAFTANAMAAMYEMLSTCFGWLFVLFGCFEVAYFGSRIQFNLSE